MQQPRKIADRYRVESQIGQGGMGAVWLCTDEKLGRQVALKQVVSRGEDDTEPDHTRALREARSLAALNQRNVVSVYDAVEEHAELWLVMEYVHGRSLAELLEGGPISPEEAVLIGAQVADGLAAAHEQGITHRDVKPANILITDGGVAKISDFGIALMVEDARLTGAGLVAGTPSYFAPEMARGEDPAPVADVWALGATLYAAVEGHGLYPATENALAVLNEIASRKPPRPENAGFLAEPIARALDPDPASRWSMADLAHVLHRLADQHAVTHTRISTAAFAPSVPAGGAESTRTQDTAEVEAVREPTPEPAPPAPPEPTEAPVVRETRTTTSQPRRRRGLAVLGVLALLVIAVGAGFLVLGGGGGNDTSSAAPSAGSDDGTDDEDGGSGSSASGSGGSADGATAAEDFVGSYYEALPTDTRTGWDSLTPGFQDSVGSYGDYRGFWATISDVQVEDLRSAGEGAVDVDLTYVKQDGSSEEETRRIYLERSGDSYLISGDDPR